KLIPYLRPQIGPLAAVTLAPQPFTGANVRSAVVSRTWRESDLRAFLGMQKWGLVNLQRAVNARPPGPKVEPDTGAFAFRERLGFFGNNAPKWKSLPHSVPPLPAIPYDEGWDPGDTGTGEMPRSIWTDSQGDPLGDVHAYLERPVPSAVQKSWML